MREPTRRRAHLVPGIAKPPYPYYSDAVEVRFGRFLFISGQSAIDESNAVVGSGDIRSQTRQVLTNIRKIIESAGGQLDNIVAMTVYTTNIEEWEAIADERARIFGPEARRHSSTLVQVSKLDVPGCMVEMTAVAVLGV